MKIEEAHPLAEKFMYVALGHGHKPYVIETPAGIPYAFNPGAPERVNFGEEKYDKGYYLVAAEEGRFIPEFRTTEPRPMLVAVINLDGAEDAAEALSLFRQQAAEHFAGLPDGRAPLLELKLAGRVGFHPFELGRERLRLVLDEFTVPLHVEIKNHLSLVTRTGGEEVAKKSLSEIELDVLHELIGSHSHYQDRAEELADLSLAIRDLVLKGDVDDDELLGLFSAKEITMRILSISLKNIKSHRERELHFVKGINVLSGVNGAGKSTVFEAIGYGLFGVDARDFVGNIDRFITIGEKKGEISVTFTTDTVKSFAPPARWVPVPNGFWPDSLAMRSKLRTMPGPLKPKPV